jgi:muramoyltetrapeptide carboxypeptidase
MKERPRKRVLPHPVSEGDSLGVVAPASPFSIRDFQKGINTLTTFGFKFYYHRKLFNRHGYLAGSDMQRADQFMKTFNHPRVKAVIAARGGYGSMRILNLIDWKKLGQHRKLFIGYSDNTFIHGALYSRLNLPTIHGSHVCEMDKIPPESVKLLCEIISGAVRLPLKYDGKPVIPGRAEGPLWGGNLSIICHMIGSGFLPRLDGHILFLEDKGEALYRIDRALTHLKMSGILTNLQGVVLGDFINCGSEANLNKLFYESFSDLRIPVIMGVACGHGPRNLPLPLGVNARIDANEGNLVITEDWTGTE